MTEDRHWVQYLNKAVEIIYDDDGVYQIDDVTWDIFVTDDNDLFVSFYGMQKIDFVQDVIALAEWCKEGLQ